jgi:hypothetical protein
MSKLAEMEALAEAEVILMKARMELVGKNAAAHGFVCHAHRYVQARAEQILREEY